MTTLEAILEAFEKCNIQSEMEVRSGFILPLLEFLGFPLECKAEEFPVYGSEGSKSIPAKQADFLLFSSNEFASHRDRTIKDIDWVQKHSLLVVEAKKSGQLPETFEQPYYYVTWTKAVAYIITDGIRIIARMSTPFGNDEEVINCQIRDLTSCQDLMLFSFASLFDRKRALRNYNNPTGLIISKIDDPMDFEIVTSSTDITLPKEMIKGMRRVCGLPDSSSEAVVLGKFLSMTETFLEYDIRYDIPHYMIGIPRGESDAFLYIDNEVAPLIKGKVTYSYANELEMIGFETSFVKVVFSVFDNGAIRVYVELNVFSNIVIERKKEYEKCLRIFEGKAITVKFKKNGEEKTVSSNRNIRKMKSSDRKAQDTNVKVSRVLLQYMDILLSLQDYYNITFDLSGFDHLSGEEIKCNVTDALCLLRASIGVQNLIQYIPEEAELSGIRLEGGTMAIEDMGELAPKPIVLHGVVFVPKEVTFYPIKISRKYKREGYYTIPIGCTYSVSNTNDRIENREE